MRMRARMLQPMIQASYAKTALRAICTGSAGNAICINVISEIDRRCERQSTESFQILEYQGVIQGRFSSAQNLVWQFSAHGNPKQTFRAAPRKRWYRKQEAEHAYINKWISHFMGTSGCAHVKT